MRTSTEEVEQTVLTAALNWAERRVPVGFDGDGGAGDGAGASEGDPAAAGAGDAGASSDGGSGGTQGASDGGVAAFEARIARQEATIRQLQADRDRAVAQLAKGGESGSGQSFDPDVVVASLEERFEKRATMKEAAMEFAASDKFKYADKAILKRAVEFDSPEALEAALEASHRSTASVIEAAVQEERAAFLKEVEEKYGVRVAPAGEKSEEKSADPTIEQIEAMSLEQMGEFESKNPGVIARVLSLRS